MGSAPSSTAPAATPRRSTHGQILKSSVLIGGSSAFNIAIGIVRTKAMALLLGPAGFGLMGLYTSIVNLAQCIAGMGVNSSGVRQIAAASGSGDPESVKRTATVLRRASLVLGLSGAVLLVMLSRPVSRLTFDSYERALPVAILSLAVLFKSVSDGQGALIQGLRRISDLAKISILGGLFGTIASVALVYVFRERGVAPSLIAIAGASLVFSWWFSRKVGLETPALSAVQFGQEARALLRLGFAFMASGMLTMGAAYAVRIMIVRRVGFEAAGLYQSAWTLGGLYVGFVLQAMGADFYPRLTAAVRDREECNRLVNEQAEVSLLLAGPGIIATLAFAPLVVSLLYSSAFGPAVEVLRWICLGATLQVITWPMGFIIVAEGRQAIFFWSEVVYTAIHLGVAWVLVGHLGVNGAGVAFFISYVCHGLLVYPIVRWITGFRWSASNHRLGLVFLAFIGLVFCSFYVLPFWLATVVGGLSALSSAVYCLRALVRLVSPPTVPPALYRLLVWGRLVSRGEQ
jgi:enterobacterial common antigen flippase